MNKVKTTNDILSDALTRMRNAIGAKKEAVILPNTKLVLEVLKVLSNYKYIGSYEINADENLVVNLKTENGYRFSHLERVSKPGVRRYVGAGDIRIVKGGKGLAIISTSKGVMSGLQATKEKVGGEYLCKVW